MEEEDYEELIVPPNFENYSRSSSDEIQINNCDILNYKGYFVDQEQNDNDDDMNEQRFYEFGAHFPYYFLVQKLEILKLEYEQKEKKQHNIPINNNNNNNLLDGIKLKQNGRSRNRNVNFGIQSDNAHIIDRFSAITKDKINNDEKTKQPNHDAMSMILKDSITTNNHIDNENKELNTKTEIIATHKHINKTNDEGNNNNNNMKMSNGTTNNKSVKAYTSFANKLKEAKRCNNNNNNISNTGRNYHNATNIPIRKNSTQINGNNNHNVINNNMKNNNTNKTVQVANDKTRNNNFRECGALSQNITSSKQKNKLEKKIKHTSNSANNNNNNNNNNKNINEDGNNCKNKQGDINRTKSKEFSASSNNNNNNNNNNLHNAKITNSINNLLTSYKYKRNIHFSPGLHPQPTKITQKGINISNINNNNNNIPPNNKTSTQVKILTKNKIQDFITSLNKTSKQKSRNCNTNNPTVNTILKNNNNNRTILTSHTKLNAQTDREKPQQLIPLTNDKARSASNKVKNTKGKVKSNKYKTYIDLKFNVFNKTNQQIINEIKKKLENNPNEHQHVNSHSKNTNTSKTKTSSKSKTTKSHKVLKSSTVDESNLNSKNGFYKIIDSSSHNEHKGKTIRNDITKNKNGKCK